MVEEIKENEKNKETGEVKTVVVSDSKRNNSTILVVLSVILIGIILVNFVFANNIKADISKQNSMITVIGNVVQQYTGTDKKQSTSSGSLTDVIPTGVPRIYGQELGISYDDISPIDQQRADRTIKLLGSFDNQITLTGEKQQRYINIGLQISCEYCCGAQSIIFSTGRAACGCAHSFAMRGLAKYLLQNHADEFTDDEILEELGKWKTLFFPTIMTQKAGVLKEKGIEPDYINLASNKYRDIEKGAASGGKMVGGC